MHPYNLPYNPTYKSNITTVVIYPLKNTGHPSQLLNHPFQFSSHPSHGSSQPTHPSLLIAADEGILEHERFWKKSSVTKMQIKQVLGKSTFVSRDRLKSISEEWVWVQVQYIEWVLVQLIIQIQGRVQVSMSWPLHPLPILLHWLQPTICQYMDFEICTVCTNQFSELQYYSVWHRFQSPYTACMVS